MDVTEICKGCFSRKHGDEASACPYCEYEEGIVDVDGAGWKTVPYITDISAIYWEDCI